MLSARCEKTALQGGLFGIYRDLGGLGKLQTFPNSKHPVIKNQHFSVLPISILESRCLGID